MQFFENCCIFCGNTGHWKVYKTFLRLLLVSKNTAYIDRIRRLFKKYWTFWRSNWCPSKRILHSEINRAICRWKRPHFFEIMLLFDGSTAVLKDMMPVYRNSACCTASLLLRPIQSQKTKPRKPTKQEEQGCKPQGGIQRLGSCHICHVVFFVFWCFLLLWFCMREENALAEVADGGEIMKPTQSWLWRDGVIHVKWVVVIVNVINDSVIVNITNQVLTIGPEVEAKKESCSSSLCCVLSVCFFFSDKSTVLVRAGGPLFWKKCYGYHIFYYNGHILTIY